MLLLLPPAYAAPLLLVDAADITARLYR